MKIAGSALSTVCEKLPWGLQRSLDNYDVYDAEGKDPARSVADARKHLERASLLAQDLATALAEAQTAINTQGYHPLTLNDEVSAEEEKIGLFHQNVTIGFGQTLRFSPLETWRILGVIRKQANIIGKAVHGFVWDKDYSTQALDNLKKGILVNERISSRKQGDTSFLQLISVRPVQ